MNERKVGVLTFHRAANYGAVLQAYALQKCLATLGFSPSLIDYEPERRNRCAHTTSQRRRHDRLCRMLSLSFIRNTIVNKTRTRLCQNKQARLGDICSSFIDRHTTVAPGPIRSNNKWKIEGSYHALITGSDQVWNTRWSDLDPVYFLNVDCCKARRIAYAPSLGGLAIPQNLKHQVRDCLSAYHALSVREESSLAELRACTNRSVSIVPDPVFLIDPPLFKGSADEVSRDLPYILVYRLSQSLRQGAEFKRIVRSAEAELGLRVVTISPEAPDITTHSKDILPEPENFAQLINGATLVITNSFHGLALSLIHSTPFYACPRDAHGGRQDTRLCDLLKQFDMKHRFISSVNEFKESESKRDSFDWAAVEEKRLSLKNKGIKYLTQSLSS